MEEQKKEIKMSWKVFWIVFDIIFFGIYFLYFLILSDPGGIINYFDGRLGTSFHFFALFTIVMCLPFFVIALLFYFAVAIIRMISWRNLFSNECRRRYLRIFVILFLIVFNPAFGVISIFVLGPSRYYISFIYCSQLKNPVFSI